MLSLTVLAQAAPAAAPGLSLGDVARDLVLGLAVPLLLWMARLLVGLDRRFDRIEHTLFGVNGDNGLYGDNARTKTRLHALAGHVHGIALWVGVDCDGDGTATPRDGDSPLERRVHERRTHTRRADDRPAA